MDGTPLKKLARDLGLSVKHLTTELAALGVEVEGEDHLVTNQQNLLLSRRLRELSDEPEAPKEVTLDAIRSATGLLELNQLLTQAMREYKFQPMINDSNGLDIVTGQVLKLNTDTDQELLAAAMLGRIAAVARSQEKQQKVFALADEIFTDEPGSIETLEDKDGKAKGYAAALLARCTDNWIKNYLWVPKIGAC